MKATVRFPTHLSGWPNWKLIAQCWQGWGETESLDMAGGNVKCSTATVRKGLADFYKSQLAISMWPSIYTRHSSERNEESVITANPYTHVHSSVVPHSQKLETAPVPLNGRTAGGAPECGARPAVRGREHPLQGTTWVSLQRITLTETSRSQKVPYCMIPFILYSRTA